MKQNKDVYPKKQEVSSPGTIELLDRWLEQHRFVRVAGLLLSLIFAVWVITFSIRQFASSWYAASFNALENNLMWVIIFVGIDMLRWVFVFVLAVLVIFGFFLQENSELFESFSAFYLRVFVFGLLVLIFLIGLQNFILYSIVGWKHLGLTAISEGSFILLAWMASILIILGGRPQFTSRTRTLESLFNLVFLLIPTTLIVTLSLSGFKILPTWTTLLGVAFSLFGFIVGIDELRGKPSIYFSLIATYRVFESGHASLQLLRKKNAESLASSLKVYYRMPLEQQEMLAKWILDNKKPTFLNRFWAIAKIVLSTVLLTMFVQEPAIIALKWLLKTLFGFSY